MIKILFVCTGNTCRSPMAEALFRQMLRDAGLGEEVLCQSAGLSAVEGAPASPNAVLALRECGLDISAHRARRLTGEEMPVWDLFFTMSQTHGYILEQAGARPEQIYVPGQIADPYGQDLSAYRACRDRLRKELEEFLGKLTAHLPRQIVPLEEPHLDALADLEALCFPDPWSREALKEEIDNPAACFLTVLEAGRPIGYVGAHHACGEFYLDNLAVHPDHRRKGVARSLLGALIKFAQEHGGHFLTLEVRPSNGPALALYEALGFTEVGRRKNFYTHPAEDALLLRLDLEGRDVSC